MNPLNIEKCISEGKEDVAGQWMFGCMLGVLAGVIIETISDFFGASGILRLAHIVGGSLVTIGLAGEFVIESKVSKYRDRLREINASLISETMQRTAGLNERAAAAEQRTAELQLDIEAARKRQANAEQLIGWLRLSQVPRTSNFSLRHFVGLLQSRPNGKAEILYRSEDGEASRFALELHLGLSVSGWAVSPPAPIPTTPPGQSEASIIAMGAQITGISILVRSISETDDTPYRALFNALQNLPFPQTVMLGADKRLPEDTIRVVVGPKP